MKKNSSPFSKRTMIVGAGRACTMIINEIYNARHRDEDNRISSFEPICIVDDDITKQGSAVNSVPVAGVTADIPRLAHSMDIEQIIIAIPSCSYEDKHRIFDICASTCLPIKVVPFIGNLICDADDPSILPHIRDINIDDLLGRRPIDFNDRSIAEYVNDKVCMVTGGGGSIGAEIVRQLAQYSPRLIVIIDINENNAYDIQQELIMEHGDSVAHVTLVGSVRDRARMDVLLDRYRPHVIFHAAAHKHVPLMETSPCEAVKNNVIGTWNMAELAEKYGVSKFVMISTDKAVNPTGVMGASKRLCEMIVQYMSQRTDNRTQYITTRFGNVLGSHGSVIPLFKRQIESGNPVTVTHPDIIRYFMTISEAVNLVLEAMVLSRGGEIFVLDMGKPVSIVKLAEKLIRLYGKVPYKDVDIIFTGLRPGEKLQEELLMAEEGLSRTDNSLIFIGRQIQITDRLFENDIDTLMNFAENNDEQATVKLLFNIISDHQ